MVDTEDLRVLESAILRVMRADTSNFFELAEIAGLDVTRDLVGADLTGVDLRGTDLSGVDLRGADLRGADLSEANLRGTLLDDETRIDTEWRSKWEILNHAEIRSDISSASSGRANLSKAENHRRNTAVEAEPKNKTAPVRARVPPSTDVTSALPPNTLAILERGGIELVARGCDIVIRLNQAALDLMGRIYNPNAGRVREVDDNLSKLVENALEGNIAVVSTRLQISAGGTILLDLQWVALSPDQAPAVEVEIGGYRSTAAWQSWVPDDLPKTLQIEAGGMSPKAALESGPVVELTWSETSNLLRVWLEANGGTDSD